jgi:hypothetical protein
VNDRDLYVAGVKPAEVSSILLSFAQHENASDEVAVSGKPVLSRFFEQELKNASS